MLLRLKVKNFLSFYEETEFNMFPNVKWERFSNHIYADMAAPVLKQAAIYGANGSGKSNFVAALGVLRNVAVRSDALKNFPITPNKFRLASENNQEPISWEIEFFQQGKGFIYRIAVDDGKIVNEELWRSEMGQGKNKRIFKREGEQLTMECGVDKQVQQMTAKLLRNSPLSSSLSLNHQFPFLCDDDAGVAYEWFHKHLVILSLHFVDSSLISRLSRDKNFLHYVSQVIEEIGLGVNQIRVDEKTFQEVVDAGLDKFRPFPPENILNRIGEKVSAVQFQNNKIVSCIEENEHKQKVLKRLLFNMVGMDGFSADLESEIQSDGTTRVIHLLPALFNLKSHQLVYVIDEIENSIHPNLIVSLIKHFSMTPTQGQLIYTTHETELLNVQEILRPDEVWFTEKSYGATKMYSLNDFKLNNDINIKNGYLAGRYGAIPFIGDLGASDE
ncbi:MAG: ATP-binding protein [Planctomycetota bacterium]|jgi:AAA15 family ATPase/GTPase|nr:ATP-binding protein [Planctomycetota bacterium]